MADGGGDAGGGPPLVGAPRGGFQFTIHVADVPVNGGGHEPVDPAFEFEPEDDIAAAAENNFVVEQFAEPQLDVALQVVNGDDPIVVVGAEAAPDPGTPPQAAQDAGAADASDDTSDEEPEEDKNVPHAGANGNGHPGAPGGVAPQ